MFYKINKEDIKKDINVIKTKHDFDEIKKSLISYKTLVEKIELLKFNAGVTPLVMVGNYITGKFNSTINNGNVTTIIQDLSIIIDNYNQRKECVLRIKLFFKKYWKTPIKSIGAILVTIISYILKKYFNI